MLAFDDLSVFQITDLVQHKALDGSLAGHAITK
jgi:hypothetical protein